MSLIKLPHKFATQLVDWFAREKRDFPWRSDPHPYKVWVAEIMSQQTVMAALLPYFVRFMERFPTVQALAAAPEDELLSAWAGLGYYSRARNVHKAAKIIAAQGFPTTAEVWQSLPGVGPYTAAAVASQCFSQAVPVWDGNVQRVMSRVLLRKDAYSPQFRKEGEVLLGNVLTRSKVAPSYFNQGLMELGATVCTPKVARCEQCPISFTCGALKEEKQSSYPPPKERKAKKTVQVGALVIWRKKANDTVEVYLQKRPKGSWFAGLYDVFSELGGVKNPHIAFDKRVTGALMTCGSLKKLKTVRHTVTHHDIYFTPQVMRYRGGGTKLPQGGQWVSLNVAVSGDFALATTAKKLLAAAALEKPIAR